MASLALGHCLRFAPASRTASHAALGVPVIIEQVVADIDVIVRRVSFTGWQTSQPGDRQVRVELRKTLAKHGLPSTGELFDAYMRETMPSP